MKKFINLKRFETTLRVLLFLAFNVILIFPGKTFAQAFKNETFNSRKVSLGFIENKGQIVDQDNKTNSDVKYLLSIPGLNVQLKANSFSYDAYTAEFKKVKNIDNLPFGEPDQVRFSFHRIDIEFIGANPSPRIITEEPGNDYLTFYTRGTSEAGATFVNHYGKITYKDLYPGIDLVFLAEPGSNKPVEYHFIVNPGADLTLIRWKYNGSNDINLKGGNISIKTVPGILTERIPKSFYLESDKNVKIAYKETENGIFTFEGTFDPSRTLIIDPIPNPKWVTYLGGSLIDVAYCVTTDVNGNVVATGYTTSTSAIATTGAFMTTFAGTQDAFLVKYNSSGVRQWCTYLGGTTITTGYSVKTDKTGNIFIAGSSQSTTNIATTGAFQVTNGGGGYYDAFLEKFDGSGVRQWGTYYGGTGNDLSYYNSLGIDTSGNIYIDGVTNSTGTQMSTTGAFKTSMLTSGDAYDGFLIKFNSSGARQWSTYFGGSTTDYGMGLSLDASANIIMSGYTISTSAIATAGAYQTTFGGGTNDAYLAKFSTSGALIWATYFGGSLADVAYRTALDQSGNIFMSGYTVSTSGIASTGAFQTTYGGGTQDGYLAKFSPAGARLWSTYFGGSLVDVAYSVTTDLNGNAFICGSTVSTSGIATTGAYQTVFAGGSTPYDAFIAKFTSTGSLQWGTYYGGPGDDITMGISVDGTGSIYLAGQTVSSAAIATTGAQQTVYGGGTYDAFIGKFQELVGYNNAGINRYTAPSTYLCAGNQDVRVEILNAGYNAINTMDIRWTVDGVAQTPVSITAPLLSGTSRIVTLGTITFPVNALKVIKAWTYMPNGVPDTVKSNDTILTQRKPGLSGSYTIGGTSPNYNTFSAAVADLNNYGICGPVNFMISPGTYTERFSLNQVIGTSFTNKINFIGAGKGSTILTYAGTSTADMSTIMLNGADQVTFRNMTIKNTGSTYGAGIWLTGTSDSNRFINLAIIVDTTTVSATVNGIVSSGSATATATDGNTGSYCLFDSITVNGGYYGLRINGPNTTTSYVTANIISHSIFWNQYSTGIYLHAQSLPVVTYNIMKPPRYTTSYSIYLDYLSNLDVHNNNILANDCGIYLNYVNRYLLVTGFVSKIYNNMISSVAGYAFYSNQASLLKIWHNSFSSEPLVAVVRFVGSLTTDLVNNHIQNRGTVITRYALQTDAITTFSAMDYNNYYSTGSYAYVGTMDYGNLPVLQAAFPTYNMNSYSQDPLFFASTDLHTSINLSGIYVGIDDDIDGDFRNTVSPVLGADEANIPNNAGISKLISPVPAFCAGTQVVKVQIGNYGINPIDSVWVYWKLNGVPQTPVFIKTTIPLRGFNNVTLGTISFAVGETKNIKVWTSLPNGVVDPLPKNDTLVINVKTGLSGTYTVGGTNPDFTNFTQAISALNQLGICSPVVFNVRAGTYNERLTIGVIRGVSTYNTVTFKGAGKTSTNLSFIGSSVNDWATIMMQGTDHFIFRDMTVSAMGTSYGIGILLTSGADTNQFINMFIQTSTTSTSLNLAGIAVMTSPINMYAAAGKPGDGNLFDSLEVSGGYYGIYFAGNSKYQTVSHCILTDQYLGQIDCSNQAFLLVHHNTATTLRTTAFSSLNLTTVANFRVYANNFNIAGSNGVYIQNSNVIGRDTNFHSVFYNNMISNTVGYSLYCENSDAIGIWHNSFRSVGTSSTIYASVYIKNTANIDMRNNHIRNDNPSSYALYADFGTFDSLDYNNYYSFGNFVIVGSAYPNLTALKAGIPQYNQHSYSQNPQYISLTNLHNTSFLAGIYVGIDEDIDGESRCPSTVSVGADDINWGFTRPVIATNHVNYFTNYPIRFSHNISGISGISFKWYINGAYITDSLSMLYIFHNPGTYKISLKAERCIYRDSASLTIQIVPGNHLITLNGNNPDTINVFNSYTDPGAKAKDFLGVDISNLITSGNNIDTAVLGTYYIWYKVQDSWGNFDSTARKIVVIDDIAPVLKLNGKDTMTIEVFQNIHDPGATVTDNYDTGLTVITDSSKVNIKVVGLYKVIYSSTDHSGNKGTAYRWIKIVDTGLPVISLIGSDTIKIDVYSQYYEAGAKVTDNYCTSGLVWQVDFYPNTNVLATYTLTYTATDCQGNLAKPVKRVVQVVDRQKPIINLNGFAYTYAERWTTYVDDGVSIDDNYYSEDTLQKLLVVTTNVDMIMLGTYNVCYQVTDPSGNKAVKVCRIVQVRSTTSVNNSLKDQLKMYPNPNNGRFTLDLGETPTEKAVLTLTDLAGKEVYSSATFNQKTNFNLEGLSNGVYQLRIQYRNETAVLRVNIIR